MKSWRDGMVRMSDDTEDVRKSKDSANRILSQANAAFNLAYRSGLDEKGRAVFRFDSAGAARALKLLGDHTAVSAFKPNDDDGQQVDQNWVVRVVHTSKEELEKNK